MGFQTLNGISKRGKGFGFSLGTLWRSLRWSTDPVEVVEGGPELVELLLADALGVSRQDLVLNFVDGASDGGEELLPAHADVLGTKRKRFSVLMAENRREPPGGQV